ncbi:MAG TPA: anaerobic ribonucleoside-triphosphate reductase [Burkholderiaceae bacterium]
MNDMRIPEQLSENIDMVLNDAERQPCEIWTRVMGYHRPVSSFNIGKKGEFHERRYFDESRIGEAA